MRESVDEMKATTAVAQRTSETTGVAAAAALEANNLTRKTLGAELRPWTKLKLKLIVPPPYNPQRTEWRLDLEHTLENVGKTPATRVKFLANVIPFLLEQGGTPGGKPDVERTDVSAALREWSNRTSSNAQTDTPGSFGSLIFPGEALKVVLCPLVSVVDSSDWQQHDIEGLGHGERGPSQLAARSFDVRVIRRRFDEFANGAHGSGRKQIAPGTRVITVTGHGRFLLRSASE
jgi:hypothetical protein